MRSCKKSMLAALLLLILSVSLAPAAPAAASTTVRVALPYFPVRINGQAMDQTHSQYPFLYYKEVTYLPLTWNNIQALGLRVSWSEEEGLFIYPNLDFPPTVQDKPLDQDLTEKSNSEGAYTARLAQGPVRIGSVSIDNSAEPYPFLEFRDVTYMPMTWRFVHDLLQSDIRWSEEEGLHLISGQHMLGVIMGEDDQALYFQSMYYAEEAKGMIRMDKTDFSLQWRSRQEADALWQEQRERPVPYAGKPVKLVRKDRDLYYGDVKIYTFTDSDLWESSDWGAPVHTYKEYRVGDDTAIISVNLRISIAAIGPNYGTTYNFLVRGDHASMLENFQSALLDRVIPNPDGTAWIAADRLPGRNIYIPGSARLGLLDQEGNVHLVNSLLEKSDVQALGLKNAMLENPADENGGLYIVTLGEYSSDMRGQPVEGVYSINTKLETTLISNQTQGDFYLDRNRTIFVRHGNNMVENLTTGEIRNWFDYDLIRMK